MKHKKKDAHHMSHHMKGREGMSKGFVEGHDEGVGRGDFANMPQHVVMKEYPKAKSLRGGMLDDTITGIDSINSSSESMTMRHLSNQK